MRNGHDTQKAATVTGSGTGAQPAVLFQLGPKQGGLVQASFGATGTLRIQGRIDKSAPWVDLTADITNATAAITVLTNCTSEMRVNITANTGTIDVWIQA